MDRWKFYDITHREHVICNPTSEEKLARIVELLRLPVDGRVVDIACGKGEFLSRLAQWRQEPCEEYLQVLGEGKDAFGAHAGNVEVGEERGLDLVHTLVSNKDDWDRYEGLQWYAAAEYGRSHPGDPDLPELVGRVAKEKAAYLRWGRDTLGWAIYVFRRRIPEAPA